MMWGSNRASTIYKFVVWSEVESYFKLGWQYNGGLEGTHHGETACIMEWMCDCPCPILKSTDSGYSIATGKSSSNATWDAMPSM